MARSLRGEHTQNWHFGAAAVVTPEGRLVACLGDPQLRAFVRSTAKPVQLLPLLEAGGRDRFGLSAEEVAVMCSSHCGTEEHVQTVAALLARGECDVENLECGVHPPLNPEVARRLAERGLDAGPLHNNCSGQHAGSLLTCRLLELELAGYVRPEHPLQRLIGERLSAMTGVGEREMEIGIDGCQMPTYRLPLRAVAWAYARLADPAAGGVAGPRHQAIAEITGAITAAPHMLAGRGRFTTRLIAVTGGRLIGKEGAEGYYAVAVRGPVALGVALKIADGTDVCRNSVVLDVLRQLGVLSAAEFEELGTFYQPVTRNNVGDAVGRIVTDFELREATGRELEASVESSS